MKTEPQPQMKMIERFHSLEEIFADQLFPDYLQKSIDKHMTPPPAPKGKRYAHTPWVTLKASRLDNPDSLMREFHLINKSRRLSLLNSIAKAFVIDIVQHATKLTVYHYMAIDNPTVVQEQKKHAYTPGCIVNCGSIDDLRSYNRLKLPYDVEDLQKEIEYEKTHGNRVTVIKMIQSAINKKQKNVCKE